MIQGLSATCCPGAERSSCSTTASTWVRGTGAHGPELDPTTSKLALCSPRLAEAIDVPGAHRRLLLPLALDGGASSPAVTLFVERARALHSRIDFAEPATAAAVLEICRSLDGLPLGIELPRPGPSRRARSTSATGSATDSVSRRLPRAPRRQQTLRDVVAWSYDLLEDDERALLDSTAVFAGGFDLAAITEVLGSGDDLSALDIIDSLVRKSLVVAHNAAGPARYLVLETIRQFVEDGLVAAGSLYRHGIDMPRTSHTRLSARWARLNGPDWRDCVDWVQVELANLRAAFGWSRRRGDLETATDVAAHDAPRAPRSSCSRPSDGPRTSLRTRRARRFATCHGSTPGGLGLLHRPPGRGCRRGADCRTPRARPAVRPL